MDTREIKKESVTGERDFDVKPDPFSSRKKRIIQLHKKTERLVAAIYLVSELLPEPDPIRLKLRQSGIDLMSYILSSKNYFSNDSEAFVSQYGIRVLEVLSLIDIAYLSGLISEMNHEIIGQEMNVLIDMAEFMKKEAMNPTIANKDIFAKEHFIRGGVSFTVGNEKHNIGQRETRLLKIISNNVGNKRQHKGHDERDVMYRKGHRSFSTEGRSLIQTKDSRRKIILDLLEGGKTLTIKDFSVVITDCSEKTIQRELLALVDENVLKKEGERRWSRYSLKTIDAIRLNSVSS